jgi:hypothetical protein
MKEENERKRPLRLFSYRKKIESILPVEEGTPSQP